jgi:hypothetical protein
MGIAITAAIFVSGGLPVKRLAKIVFLLDG